MKELTFEQKPPKIKVLEITRGNYEDVAYHLKALSVEVLKQGHLPGWLRVTMKLMGHSDFTFAFPAFDRFGVERDETKYYIRRDDDSDMWSVVTEYELKTYWTDLNVHDEDSPVRKAYVELLPTDVVGALPGLEGDERVKIGDGIYEYRGATYKSGERSTLTFEFVRFARGVN